MKKNHQAKILLHDQGTGDLTQAVTTSYAITTPAIGGVGTSEIQTPLNGLVTFAAGAAEVRAITRNADTFDRLADDYEVLT